MITFKNTLKIIAAISVFSLVSCSKPGMPKTENSLSIETNLQEQTTQQEHTAKEDIPDKGRTYIADGFSFGPLNETMIKRITGVSYPKTGAKISLDDLSYIRLLHYDFEGNIKQGELIINKALAKEVTEIFYKLFLEKYPLASVRIIDDFDADDEASMSANNTSAFNYRLISGSNKLSKHGSGTAIDINPLYNPCINKSGNVEPASGKPYTDRSKTFAGKIDKNDLAYKLFKEAGWTWGGNWSSLKDYQHFEKDI